MAHELEVINGKASFFSHRQPAWHQLGNITDHALTLDEALVEGGLDWKVSKSESIASTTVITDLGVGIVSVDGKYITYRNHPQLGLQGLGVVGKQYQVVQNREIGELVEHIADESGGVWETAGSLFGGRRVFMSIKLPESMLIGGEDKTDMYLVIASSHDGTLAVTAITTAVRVVCNNTFSMALKDAASKYVFRHSGDAGFKVQEAREALALTFKYQEEFESEMERLLAVPMNGEGFDAFSKQLLPVSQPTQLAQARAEKARMDLLMLWVSPTQDFGRGTAYGALNTVTEYDQWVKAVKGKDEDAARALRNLTADTGRLSTKAFALLSS